jgi:hypothetical protein
MNPYEAYYVSQAGKGVGPVFTGSAHQRGHGIGNFLSSIFRAVFPLVKSGAKAIGKEAMDAGFGVLRDTIQQKPLKQSIKERMREAGDHLMTKAEHKIDEMQGSGYKRKRKRQGKAYSKKQTAKKQKRDIFTP